MTSTAIASAAATTETITSLPVDEHVATGELAVLEADYDRVLKAGSIKGTMKDKGYTANDLWLVDPRVIRVLPGFNPRVINDDYRAVVRSIADSIKANGYYKSCPMAGYVAIEDGEQVIYMYEGHRRLEGSMLAISEGYKLERVTMTIDQVGLSLEDMTVALIQGNRKGELSFYETAITCKRLLKMGVPMEEIARRTGLTQQGIDARMKLMAAPFKLREMVGNNHLSFTLAMELLDEHGSNAVAVAEEAQSRAAAVGKTKVLKAQLQTSPYTKVVKKVSTQLFEVAGKIHKDPAYAKLSAETREALDALLAEIETKAQAKKKGKVDGEGAAETEEEGAAQSEEDVTA